MFGGLLDVYKCKISFFPQPWWPTVMQVHYTLTVPPILPLPPPPFLNKANLRTALQAGQKGEKLIKSFLRSNKRLFFAILFILWFKSHQTLYIFVSLAHGFNTLLSYSICLWNCLAILIALWEMITCNNTFRDDFYAVLVWEILILSTESSIRVFARVQILKLLNQGD